jgi:hypothetical protein
MGEVISTEPCREGFKSLFDPANPEERRHTWQIGGCAGIVGEIKKVHIR